MSARRIKRKSTNVVAMPEGPLDWIRTDDKSMVDCFYILCMTRGLPTVVDALREALAIEVQACRELKAKMNPAYQRDAEFLEEARSDLAAVLTNLLNRWAEGEDDPPVWSERHEAAIGGLYPLPGAGVYSPKR